MTIDGVELRDRVWFDVGIASSVPHYPSLGGLTGTQRLSDRQVVDTVAQRLAVPRATVAAHEISFVLHAPLELLARATLLPAGRGRRSASSTPTHPGHGGAI